MNRDYTAVGLSLRNAGILIMEDGLTYGRAIDARSRRSDWGAAASASSFECVVLLALAGITMSAGLLLASSGETIAAMAAALTP